jgi:hypothetical protein
VPVARASNLLDSHLPRGQRRGEQHIERTFATRHGVVDFAEQNVGQVSHGVQESTRHIAESEARGDVAQRLGMPLHDVNTLVADCASDRADALTSPAQYHWNRTRS